MKNIKDIQITEAFLFVLNWLKQTTKKQRIIFFVTCLLLVIAYLIGMNLWDKHKILKQVQNIVEEISKVQQNAFSKNKKYEKNIFANRSLARLLNISLDMDMEEFSSRSRRRSPIIERINEDTDYSVAYTGDFTIENNADEGCVVLRYRKNPLQRTIFYASFKDGKIYCRGKKCFKDTENDTVDLCYKDGFCFPRKQKQTTKRTCGNGQGQQTRECTPSCDGGICEDWGECVCKKGFEWDGTTCKQSQTEKDCTQDQCFNGIYCEDKEPVTKNIDKGSCVRRASCQKNKGWLYSSWDCSCEENFCSLKETCVPHPGDKDKLVFSDKNESCDKISYTCENGKGWQAKAKKCVCNKPGIFWNKQEGNAQCSQCTKKPVHAIFTTSGKTKDDCKWKCEDGYQNRKNDCVKPDGQYLCARTDISTCTDYFSKSRKMKVDAKKTNEGQPCFVEDKDNVLFYNKKPASCQICQCVVNTAGSKANYK